MPEISRFYGIIIYMNFNDHYPPHFHAKYQDQEVSIEIESGNVTGFMDNRLLRMLFKWLELHKNELRYNWQAARNRKPLNKIPSME